MTTQHIWETYHQDVKQFIVSKVKDEDVANDLLQETFIKIHTKKETLQHQEKLKSWIFTIARNTVLDYFKQITNTREFFDADSIVEEGKMQHNETDCLHGIIGHLPKKYRNPLFLSDIKGMKQADIAKQLKLQLSTTKSRIQRARKKIAQGYMECCDLKLNQKGFLVGEIKDKEDCKLCS
ncbi:MAG: RNA polymerase subunit sigma-70 [Bacteroidetes bacterium]|nr:MAG: RNA polymerase subunit sigma-70 [Bacteroidota bacterium]